MYMCTLSPMRMCIFCILKPVGVVKIDVLSFVTVFLIVKLKEWQELDRVTVPFEL